MSDATPPKILVLGVGNILFTDEGLGVRCVERLMQSRRFGDNVTLLDGGTLGMGLMDALMACDRLIVVDAVFGDGRPGDVYRLVDEDLRKSIAFKNSMHQTDLVDTLIFCDLAGKRPEAVVVGMEPFDLNTMAVGLSPLVEAKLLDLEAAVLKELDSLGAQHAPRENT